GSLPAQGEQIEYPLAKKATDVPKPGHSPQAAHQAQGARMTFAQILDTAATVYGVLAALTALLQTRQMLARRTSCEVSARFMASYAGGYAIWLTYGLSTGSLPLIVVDTVRLPSGGPAPFGPPAPPRPRVPPP